MKYSQLYASLYKIIFSLVSSKLLLFGGFIRVAMSECQKNELLIENSCFPMKIPGENCIHNDQCLSYLFEPKYYCIDGLCQQKNLHNIPLIGIPETIMNSLSISPKRLSPPRFKKELMKPFAWMPKLSFTPKIYKGQVCRGTYSRPQMMQGVVVECMSNPCAPNYECEYVHGSGRYICCSRKNIASSQMMSSLGLAALSRMPQNYGLSSIPSSISAGSGCVTKTCTTCTRECGCMQRAQNEYLCCPNQLVQPNLNFGFLQWTIAINLSPVPQDCLPPDFGYCYCPSVKIVASIIPIIPIVPTTTTTSPDPNICGTCLISTLQLISGTGVGETPTISNGCQTTSSRNLSKRPKRQTSSYSVTVVCDASSAPNTIVLMEFNNGELGGPSANQLPVVSATFNCVNGLWYYTENGVTTKITSVLCSSTASTMVNPCTSCKVSELTLAQGTFIGEMPMIPNGLITEANGCVSANVVCDASSVPIAIVRMEFNNGETSGPSANQMPTVAAKLTCGEDEKWYYNDGTVTNQIFEVRCSSTACGVCALNSLTLLPAHSTQNEHMASIPNGCAAGTIDASSGSLQILCQNPIATGNIAINYFDNDGMEYLLPEEIGTSTMTINCINGVWTYEGTTVASIVCLDMNADTMAALEKSRLRKIEKPIPKSTEILPDRPNPPKKSGCSISSLLIGEGTDPREAPSVRPRKNQTLEITCTSTYTKGGTVFMEFNKLGLNPFHPSPNLRPKVTAKLRCIDGNWRYVKNGTDEIVEQVSCIQKRTLKLRRNPRKGVETQTNTTNNTFLSTYHNTSIKDILSEIETIAIRRKPKIEIELETDETMLYVRPTMAYQNSTSTILFQENQTQEMQKNFETSKTTLGITEREKITWQILKSKTSTKNLESTTSSIEEEETSTQQIIVFEKKNKKNSQEEEELTGIWKVLDQLVQVLLIWI